MCASAASAERSAASIGVQNDSCRVDHGTQGVPEGSTKMHCDGVAQSVQRKSSVVSFEKSRGDFFSYAGKHGACSCCGDRRRSMTGGERC